MHQEQIANLFEVCQCCMICIWCKYASKKVLTSCLVFLQRHLTKKSSAQDNEQKDKKNAPTLVMKLESAYKNDWHWLTTLPQRIEGYLFTEIICFIQILCYMSRGISLHLLARMGGGSIVFLIKFPRAEQTVEG